MQNRGGDGNWEYIVMDRDAMGARSEKIIVKRRRWG